MSIRPPTVKDDCVRDLTEAEKSAILERVRGFMARNPLPTAEDVRALFYAFAQRVTLIASLAVGVFALALRFAAVTDAAVPGDALYALKVHVMESVRSAMSLSDGERVTWESHRLQRRLQEAHELAERNQLDERTVSTVIDTFESQAAVVDAAVESVARNGGPRSTAMVRQRLVEAIREREREFQKLSRRVDVHADVDILISRLRAARLRLLHGEPSPPEAFGERLTEAVSGSAAVISTY